MTKTALRRRCHNSIGLLVWYRQMSNGGNLKLGSRRRSIVEEIVTARDKEILGSKRTTKKCKNDDQVASPSNSKQYVKLNHFKDKQKNTKVNINLDSEKIVGDMNYVLILNNAVKERNCSEISANDTVKGIYVFNENETNENSKTIVSKNFLRLKSNSDSAVDVHECIQCDYTTTRRYLLSRHLRAHSDDRPYMCSVCDRGFKSNASLLNHVNTHLGNKPHHCKNCAMSFTTSGELVRHVRYKHTLEKPHKCTECEYASVELSKLKRHIRCHTGERPYQCPHCTYASPDTFKLKRHMRTHTGEKPYECDICHARFTQSNSMKAHRTIHSVSEKPVFQCSLCPTTCGRKTDLRIHIQKLHQSDEPITCNKCGKSCPDRFSYKVHLKTHEGEKCFKCAVCPYASTSLRHLESHMFIHTDQKPFVCEMCNLRFRQKQLLKRHINLYHNEFYVPPKARDKRHICPECKRSFSHKGNLMRHMETHDPYSNFKQEKLDLKLGRKARMRDDGADEVFGTETEMQTEEYYHDVAQYFEGTEEYEMIVSMNGEHTDEKPDVEQVLNMGVTEEQVSKNQVKVISNISNVSVKQEADGKELVAFRDANGQRLMVVEVIQCDDDEDMEEGESLIVEHFNSNVSTTIVNKDDLKNCFGFEYSDAEEYIDNLESKEAIQLIEIIDD